MNKSYLLNSVSHNAFLYQLAKAYEIELAQWRHNTAKLQQRKKRKR